MAEFPAGSLAVSWPLLLYRVVEDAVQRVVTYTVSVRAVEGGGREGRRSEERVRLASDVRKGMLEK